MHGGRRVAAPLSSGKGCGWTGGQHGTGTGGIGPGGTFHGRQLGRGVGVGGTGWSAPLAPATEIASETTMIASTVRGQVTPL
jgi:hypothetical protein